MDASAARKVQLRGRARPAAGLLEIRPCFPENPPGGLHMTKGLPAVAAAAWLTAFGAFAQDSVLCVNDTPPAPSTTGLFCADPGLCPNQVKGLKYTQQVVTYKSVDDAGACDAPGAYCPNRCTDPRASCTNVRGGGQRCRIDLQGILFVPKPVPKSAPAVVLVTGSTACLGSTPRSWRASAGP